MAERSQDRIEHQVQLPPNIFSKETQHQVSALLQQLIFPAIAAVRDRIRQMLGSIQLDGHSGTGTQEIDLQLSETIERDRQRNVDAEATLGLLQGFQSAVEERFRCTPSSVCAVGV